MANIYPKPAHYNIPEPSPSQCSCLDCDSFNCFVRRRHVTNSCKCKQCENPNTCFFIKNYEEDPEFSPEENQSAVEPSEALNDELKIIDVKPSSAISAKSEEITPDISERLSKAIRATIELKDSIFSKFKENTLFETMNDTIERNIHAKDSLSRNPVGDKGKESCRKSTCLRSRPHDTTSCKYSFIDGKIEEILSIQSTESEMNNKMPLKQGTVCEVEAKLKNFIPRSAFKTSLETGRMDSDKVTVVNSVEVTYPSRKNSRNSTGKLAAQIMNVPYEDFRESVLTKFSCTQKPTITTYDILKRIKEAYDACSCKVCECINSIAAPVLRIDNKNICNCKPCDCNDCKKYRLGVTEQDHRTMELLDKYQHRISIDCKCKPCQCDQCTSYDFYAIRAPKEPCDCTPCQCADCKSLVANSNRTMIVAPVGEGNQRPYCSCSPCGCFECAHPYGTIAQTMAQTHTVTQEMATGTAARNFNCRCDTCNNSNCEQEGANTCNCDRHNRVVRKPVQSDNNDYDIRRVMISNILGLGKFQGMDSCLEKESSKVSFDSVFRAFSRDVINDSDNLTSHNQKGYVESASANSDSVNVEYPSRFVTPYKEQQILNISDICKCKPCRCQECKTYNLIELQTTKDSSYHSNVESNDNSCLDSSISFHMGDLQESDEICNCKLCACPAPDYRKRVNEQYQKTEQSHPTTSLYGRLLSNKYTNHLIYGEINSSHQGRSSASDPNFVVRDPQRSESNFHIYKLENPGLSGTNMKGNNNNTKDKVVKNIPSKNIKRINETYLNVNRTTVDGILSGSSNTMNSLESCNSLSHDHPDYIIQFPRKTKVQNCLRDVYFDSVATNLKFTKINVAFTNKGNRKGNSDTLVPRTYQIIHQENRQTAKILRKKPVAGQILHANLCKKLNFSGPCDCSPCKCEKCTLEKITTSCKCNCAACSCLDTCIHQKNQKDQLTQIPSSFMATDIIDSYASSSAFYNPHAKLLRSNAKRNSIFDGKIPKKQPQQVNIMGQNKNKNPGEIKLIEADGTHNLLSTQPQELNFYEHKINYSSVQKTLDEAKAYSLELRGILEKYQKANREFVSFTQKYRQSHGPLLKMNNDPATQLNKLNINIMNPEININNEKEILISDLDEENKVSKDLDKHNKVDINFEVKESPRDISDLNTIKSQTVIEANKMQENVQNTIFVDHVNNIKTSVVKDTNVQANGKSNAVGRISPMKIKSVPDKNRNNLQTNLSKAALDKAGPMEFKSSIVKNCTHSIGQEKLQKLTLIKSGPMKLKSSVVKNSTNIQENDNLLKPAENMTISPKHTCPIVEDHKNIQENENFTKHTVGKPGPMKIKSPIVKNSTNIQENEMVPKPNKNFIKNMTQNIKDANNIQEHANEPKHAIGMSGQIKIKSPFVKTATDDLQENENVMRRGISKSSPILIKSSIIKNTNKNQEVEKVPESIFNNVNLTVSNKIITQNIDTHDIQANIKTSAELSQVNSDKNNFNNVNVTHKPPGSYNKYSKLVKRAAKKCRQEISKQNNAKIIKNHCTTITSENSNEIGLNTLPGKNESTKDESKQDVEKPKISQNSEIARNISSQNYKIKNDYELMAKEMYNSIVNSSNTCKEYNAKRKDNINEIKKDVLQNTATANEINVTNGRDNINKIKTDAPEYTANEINVENERDLVSAKQSSFDFLNILNFIKRYKPELYEDIIKVSESPQYKSEQASNETIILKDEGDDLIAHNSHEMEPKSMQSEIYVPKFDPIKAHTEIRTNAINKLYGKIFRVDTMCTRYQNGLKVNENEHKIRSLLDKLFTDTSVKKLREYYSLRSKFLKQSEYINGNTSKHTPADDFKGIMLDIDASFAQMNMRRILRKEALASLKEELNKLLDIPLLKNLLKSVQSSSTQKLKTIEDRILDRASSFSKDHINTNDTETTSDAAQEPQIESNLVERNPSSSVNNDSLDRMTFSVEKPSYSGTLSSQQMSLNGNLLFGPKRGPYSSKHSSEVSSESRDSRKVNFRSVAMVSDHTIYVRWDTPKDTTNIKGYELQVDGRPVKKILGPTLCSAVISCIPHSERVVVTVRSITNGPNHSSSTIVYRRRRNYK